MRKVAMIASVFLMSAQMSAANPSLRDVSKVEDGLFAIAVADKIRKECSSISGRVLRAMGQMRNLADYAESQGYSDAEIKAYVDSDAEKARMKAKRDDYLRTQGVVHSQSETYCAAGRAEIQQKSQIGALLRAR